MAESKTPEVMRNYLPPAPKGLEDLYDPNTNPNLHVWKQCDVTDPNFTSRVKTTHEFTTVDAHYMRFRATCLWGPYGQAWGLRDIQYGFVNGPDGQPAEVHMQATFFYPDGAFEIVNDWMWRRAGESLKKLMTNTINKALSYLGFSADVWMGEFDDDQYKPQADAMKTFKGRTVAEYLKTCPMNMLDAAWQKAQAVGLNSVQYRAAKTIYDSRKLEHEATETFGGTEDLTEES